MMFRLPTEGDAQAHASVDRRSFCKSSMAAVAAGTSVLSVADRGWGTAKIPPIIDTHMHVWANDARRYPFPHPYAEQFKGPPHEGTVEMLIEDIQAELTDRPYELAQVAGGWMFRTKTQFADAIKAAADLGDQSLAFTEMEMGVLCAIAYHQPIDRAGLADIFGKEVSRDLLARLRYKDLIASGPRSPRSGAPHTFVTTETFLVTFDLQSLRDLPDLELHGDQPS